MATLEEEIRDLKAEIAEYRDMMKAAITLEEKKMYTDLIIASRNNLTALLQQQAQAQAQAGGGQAQGQAGNFNAELQELQLQEARARAEKANEDLAMARALPTLKKVRPANRGNSWLPSPGSSSQSPAEFAIVGTSLHGESSDNDSSHRHHYPLKEREYYIELFKEKFNIEYNLSKGYKVRHNSKLMIIERVAFGSKETVHTCHGDNKKVKNDYLALVLSDCQIDKFLVLIASQAGVAEEQWWLNTP